MANTNIYGGITAAIWDCVKTTSFNDHGTVYAPAGADKGTATTVVPVIGTIELGFNYDAVKDTVTYNIIKKPFLVSASQIWDGIQDTINGCSGK
jgi:hypothetical protein